jgi:triosephosphate isomerase (TIM)
MKKLIIANWKMNPSKGAEARKMFSAISKIAVGMKNVETVVCPPLVYLESLGELVTSRSCVLGAQDAFWEHAGAYTGQVSPDMVFNTKARYVIVGHSERRYPEMGDGETNDMIAKKLKSILQFPLIPILCIGEQKRDDDGDYIKQVRKQLKDSIDGLTNEEISRLVIAYEPVWAIGAKAKKECSPAECREMVQIIRQVLADVLDATESAKQIPVVYGGSVNIESAEGFLLDGLVQGLLVGRASLDPKAFGQIIKIADKVLILSKTLYSLS